MKIGELADRAGVPIETVRYYERQGVLPSPARQGSGYRRYEPSDLVRLRFVRQAKALGFSLAEIRELLTVPNGNDDLSLMREAAAKKLALVDAKLAELLCIRDGLELLGTPAAVATPVNQRGRRNAARGSK